MSEETIENTHFDFDHKVFTVENCYFALSHTRTPEMHMRLGDVDVSINLQQLRAEFDIRKGSKDDQLLTMVSEGLRFVRTIRPNDSIPKEILDGTASWSVEHRHLEKANRRMMLQLIAWLQGKEGTMDEELLNTNFESQEFKEKVNMAFGELAERLGIGRARKQEVVDSIGQLSQEISYVEALIERVESVVSIRRKLNKLMSYYRNDNTFSQELIRMEQLIRTPIDQFKAIMEEFKAQSSELLNMLRKIDVQLQFIRKTRDTLRRELLEWEDMIEKWDRQDANPTEETESLCKETYRFLAQRYLQAQRWSGTG